MAKTHHHHHPHDGPCNHTHKEDTAASKEIIIHGAKDFLGMRKAGQLAAQTLDYITPFVKAGVTTGELDSLSHQFITSHGSIPAPLGYGGSERTMPFPKSICTSVNHVVCHGIPGDKKLLDGDILNIDVTVILDGWHGDTSRMFTVGKRSVRAAKLIDVTFEAMMRALKWCSLAQQWGTLGMPFKVLPKKTGFLWCAIFVGMAWAGASTLLLKSCILGKPARELT